MSAAARQIAHLRATIEEGKLPQSQKKRAAALLERLASPVRLSILGMPKSGKSEVVNLLLGARVLPTEQTMPTSRLTYGAVWKCSATTADGSNCEIKWPTPAGFDWSKFTFVHLEAPIELLKSVSILEVGSDGSPEGLSASVAWAVTNSDMAIWCTQSMDRVEEALWTRVPDALKDHSFLAIPKADKLAASGELAERIKRLGGLADEEFYGLYPVATLQYLAALEPGKPVSKQVRAASGAGALIDAVLGDVRRGRQADLDGVEVFLSRYGVDESAIGAVPAVPTVSTGIPSPSAEPPAASRRAAPEPSAAEVVAPEVETPAKPVAPAGAREPLAQGLAGAPGLDAALAGLRALASDLGRVAKEGDSGLAGKVLMLCNTRFEDMVAELPLEGGPVADEIEAASEAMILMQIEGDDSSAADAATVVLQLTREFEMAVAA